LVIAIAKKHHIPLDLTHSVGNIFDAT